MHSQVAVDHEHFIPAAEVFLYLQLLDAITTVVGLRIGLAEASPFIRWMMQVGPLAGLAASKFIAVMLGGYCIWRGRFRTIKIINYWFASLVVWNLYLILAWVNQ